MKKTIMNRACQGLAVLSLALSANAGVGAKNYQNYDLEQFLQEFSQDTGKVLNQLPPKIDHQIIPGVTIFREEDQTTKAFIEAKDRQRKELCTERNGARVCLGDLQGRAAIEANDRAENLVENAESMVKTLADMEAKNLREGRVAVQPWSDDYWPIARGILASRYADPDKTDSLDWKEALGFFEENPYTNYVQINQQNMLSPAEKYDLLVGDSNFTLTKAMWEEGRGYFESQGKVEPWMGICHGWAPAAYMYQRPQKTVYATAANGTKLAFFPSDIKALASLLYAKNEVPTKFLGGRCDTKDPARDENGRVTAQQCFDSNPASWHLAIVNQLGVNKRSFVLDATFDYEVWNQPLVSYSYRYFNPETKRPAATLEEATVAMETFTTDKFKKYRSRNAAAVVGVEMVAEYVVEVQPVPRNFDNQRFDATTSVVYRYDLEVDRTGKLVGGEWYSNAHPDFLWTPVKDAQAAGPADRYATERWTWGQPVPTTWKRSAPYASRYGAPLMKVVDDLVKQAQLSR